MPSAKIVIPVRQLEEILADIQKAASKPRTVNGYAEVVTRIFPGAEQMIANGYELDEVIDFFLKREVRNFDKAEFRKAYIAHAARNTTKKDQSTESETPAAPSKEQPAPVAAVKPASAKSADGKPAALRSVDNMTKDLAQAV